MGSATLLVTTQSDRAFTCTEVLAYTTTARSSCCLQNASKASGGQPRSKEHSALSVGMNTRLPGERILAVSPMKRTPATIRTLAG